MHSKKMKSHGCWAATVTNYELIDPRQTESGRCVWRFSSLGDASAACIETPRCGSIVRDGGIRCGATKMRKTLPSRSTFISWILLSSPVITPILDSVFTVLDHGRQDSFLKLFNGRFFCLCFGNCIGMFL